MKPLITTEQAEMLQSTLNTLTGFLTISCAVNDLEAMNLVLRMSREIRDFLKNRIEGPKPQPGSKLTLVKD